MGCQASKQQAATVQESASTLKTPVSKNTTTNTNSKKGSSSASRQIKQSSTGGSNGSGSGSGSGSGNKRHTDDDNEETVSVMLKSGIHPNKPERLYKLLAKALQCAENQRSALYKQALEHLSQEPMAAKWENPTTKSTALHLTCRLMDTDATMSNHGELLLQVLQSLLAIYREALRRPDVSGHIPLHYALAPTTHFANNNHNNNDNNNNNNKNDHWKYRGIFLQHILQADVQAARRFLAQTDVVFESGDATGACGPLYRVLQTIPDDFDVACPTAEYVHILCTFCPPPTTLNTNSSDGDLPLALLYRRFTRQFDISEKFFSGDNSRPDVLQHRRDYKLAAGTTWKIMEILLRPPPEQDTQTQNTTQNTTQQQPQQQQQQQQNWGIVHRAVQVETPPDLLRYIVETNAQDLTRLDADGSLPLHYAAAAKPNASTNSNSTNSNNSSSSFPSFYSKYVVDELLYKFPEAASMQDSRGRYPLTIAIDSGKQWIGGGIKSLYDAYPDALKQVDVKEYPTLQRALSMTGDNDDNHNDNHNDNDKETKDEDGNDDADSSPINRGIIKDNPHDAIMLVQQPDVEATEIVSSMWAHEEDAGVQMLGCRALTKLIASKYSQNPTQILRIALSAVAAVVNAMKAHPNEMIVQETACSSLEALASADGQREVSMVASGAVSAIVGAMQAHVGDAKVQEHACLALAAIVRQADRATVVASVSGVTAILNAIAAHAAVPQVQLAGLLALTRLTDFAAEANLPELPKTQTEPLLVAARDQFGESDPQIRGAVELLLTRMSA
jgi:hypothetical protein